MNWQSPRLLWFFCNCHDSVSWPWLSLKREKMSTLKGQFCVNICSAYLSWVHIGRMINPTSLPGKLVAYMSGLHNNGITAARTDWYSMLPPRKPASHQHPIAGESFPSCQPTNTAKLISQLMKTRSSCAFSRCMGYRDKRQKAWQEMCLCNVSAATGWCVVSLLAEFPWNRDVWRERQVHSRATHKLHKHVHSLRPLPTHHRLNLTMINARLSLHFSSDSILILSDVIAKLEIREHDN